MSFKSLSLAALIALGATSAAFAQDAPAEGDPVKGKRIFARCMACHTLPEGGPNRVGPNLWGIFGRTAGTHEGFKFSPAMKAKGEEGLVWTEETLGAYVTNPREYIPGNRMVFVGLPREVDRLNLMAYLKKETTPAAQQ